MTTFNGTKKADFIIGTDKNDIIFGNGGNDTLIGGSGNDVIFGGDGSDVIIGSTTNQKSKGKDEVDVLTGGKGSDTFVLADLYNKNGSKDFARITDFSTKEKDKIQLSRGESYFYYGVGNMTEIYNNNDLIARIENVNLGVGFIEKQSWVQWV